ncbi:MAG: hypothetical protein HY652_15335 [Acidobacteria bacterium]|nr:hypothetical protein [Acidobacteriota bacterium]
MQEVLNNIPDGRLRAYIIWLPAIQSDDRASAEERSAEFADPRLTYFWDGGRLTGKLWQRALDIPRFAWDVYFLYGAEAHWEKEPAVPDFWMHQLDGVTTAPLLNQPEFELKVKELLGKAKSADHLKRTVKGQWSKPMVNRPSAIDHGRMTIDLFL